MTTLGDAIKDALHDNWAGSGGTEPALYNTEDVGQDWPPDDDWIMILGWTYEERTRRRNDAFVYKVYRIDLRAHSKNDANGEERLDTIVTEIYRILTPTNVTGYHIVDIVDQHRRASDKRTNRYIADLTVECLIKSTAAAATPGSGGTGDVVFPADVDITGDLTVTGTTALNDDVTVTAQAVEVDARALGNASFTVDAKTGDDGYFLLQENNVDKAIVIYDGGNNRVSIYNYTSGEYIHLNDAGGAEVTGATTLSGLLTMQDDVADRVAVLGKARIGGDAAYADYAWLGHRDLSGAGFAVLQGTAGDSFFNVPTGQTGRLSVNANAALSYSGTVVISVINHQFNANIATNTDKSSDIGATGVAWDNVYADDFVNESPFKKIEDPLDAIKAIKEKDDKLDYKSLPDWVRTFKRDHSKDKTHTETVIDEMTGEERDVVVIDEVGPKSIVAETGFSTNRMIVLLYQALQEASARIEALEAR